MDRLAFAAVWILVFTIPWANMVVFESAGTVTRVIGVVAIGLSALTVLATGRLRPLKGIHIVMVVFVWWAAMSFYWSLAPDLTLQQSWTYVQLVAMVWVVWQFSATSYRARGLMHAYTLGGYVAIAGTYANRILAPETAYMRYAASGFNSNEIGLILAVGIPIAWHLSTVSRGPLRWLNRLYVPLAMVAILLTGSRAAFCAAIVGLLIIPWTLGRLSQLARVAMILGVLGVAIVAYVVVPSTSLQRIAAAPSDVSEGDLNNRQLIWEAGLSVISEHAVVGVGSGSFRDAVEPILGRRWVAHNTFLSVFAEGGIIGFTLFCMIGLSLVFLVLRMTPVERKVWLVLLGVWTVGVFFITWEYRHATWLLWGLLVTNAYAVDDRIPHTVPPKQSVLAREWCADSDMGLTSSRDGN